jgi:hypothetical protein
VSHIILKTFEGKLMNSKRALLILTLILCGTVCGDGKFYFSEKVPVGIPYQRALIMLEKNKETLLVQSQYQVISSDTNTIGWVVPVPNVPELGTMNADRANIFFLLFNQRSQPNHIGLRYILLLVAIIVALYFIWSKIMGGNWVQISIAVLLSLCVLWFFLMPSLGKAKISDVDIIKSQIVGIYDVKVIKSDNAESIIQWLKENNYNFDPNDLMVFEDYVKKGWCFVAAKVNQPETQKSREVINQGLASPLILRFDANEPVYPMALTAVSGKDTEVLLYVVAPHKMDCGQKLKTVFFGEVRSPLNILENMVEPNDFFNGIDYYKCNLTKFRGRLTSQQMKDDIIFKPADNNEPYREIKWW